MTEPKKRRYFWFEGVTRKQVEDSLSDNRPTTLRQQRTRRLLVIATAASLLGMALVILIPNREMLITISVFGGILTIVLYSQLLLSVRYLSAAPKNSLMSGKSRFAMPVIPSHTGFCRWSESFISSFLS
jgi:hypothetical protein